MEAFDTVDLVDGRRVDSRMVAPGDVILLPNRCTLHFDAALLNGTAVLNESMLTGEYRYTIEFFSQGSTKLKYMLMYTG